MACGKRGEGPNRHVAGVQEGLFYVSSMIDAGRDVVRM